jgi:putative DNA primase/helicase
MPTTAQEKTYTETPGNASPEAEDLFAPGETEGAPESSFHSFTTGSDVELAGALSQRLQRLYGTVVFAEGRFWHYGETHWVEITETTLWCMAFEFNGERYGSKGVVKLASGRVESIVKCLEKLHDEPGFFNQVVQGVNCLSGFVEFASDGTPSLSPHAAWFRQRDTLQGPWDPDKRVHSIPEGSLIHTLLCGSTAGDPEQLEKIEALQRLAGAVVAGLGTKGLHPKVVVLKGVPDTGKKQLLTMFRGLVPKSAQCSISPSQFADKNFIVELAGKLLNTYDELGSTYAVTSEVFKQVATGDPVTGCRKYGHPFTISPIAQNIFACNLLPAFRGGVDPAVLKRLYIVQFDRSIPPAERVNDIGARIVAEEMELLLGLAIEGASRLIRESGFPTLKSSEDELEELAETDSVVLWFKDQITRTQLERINKDGTRSPMRLTTSQMYADYKSWAEAQGHDRKSIAHINVFSQRLRSQGLAKLNANGFRGFLGVAFKRMVNDTTSSAEKAEGAAENSRSDTTYN